MLKSETSNNRPTQGNGAEAEGGVVRRVYEILDTPVIDLAKGCLPLRSTPSSLAENNKEHPATAATKPSGQQTFAPLITEQTFVAATVSSRHTRKHDGLEHKPSILGCIKNSFNWAWRASPLFLTCKTATNFLSALIPYALAYSSARVVDALVKISGSLSANLQTATSGLEASRVPVPDLMHTAYIWFGVGALTGFAMFATNALNRFAVSRHSKKISQEVTRDMRRALTGFDPDEQFLPETTQLVNRTLQSQWAVQDFGEKLFELIVPTVSAVGAIVICAPYSPLGASLLGAFAIPYFYHSYKRGREEFSVSEQLADPQNRFATRNWSLLTGPAHLEIKLYGKSSELLEHLAEEHQKIDSMELRPEIAQQKRELWLQPLNTAVVSGVAFVVLVDVVSKAAGITTSGPSIGDYGLVAGALYSLNASIRSLASSLGEMLKNFPQAQLAHAVIQNGLSRRGRPVDPISFDAAPAIAVENLRFSYPKSDGEDPKEVLTEINLEIQPGELLGIVGESGSGKSSLVNLLCGIYRPSSGKILVNGTDLERVSRESLWACSGYMRQQSQNLWSMTLRENITVGAKEPLSDPQIIALAEECGFAEIMRRNKLSLDSVLGQWFIGGKNLSGGEQTLLALTRQAASRAKFIVLDEPTAGLDQVLADAVLERVRGLEDATRIVITHDCGIAAQADRIVVLNKGKIADIGTHEELLSRCATYQELFRRQSERLNKPTAEHH